MRKTISIYFLLAIFFVSITLKAQVTNISVGESFQFIEGPVWDGEEFIYFTDIPNNTIVKYSIVQNTFSAITTNSNRGNGLMFNSDKNLVVCEGSAGRITERSINGDIINTIVSEYENVRFNSPNDLCIDAKGGIYFTDPTFGSTEFQPNNSVYYLNSEGVTTRLIDDMQKPNGILLSNDGNILYINDTFSDEIRAYDVQEDGSLVNQRVFGKLIIPVNNGTNTGADGMATDVEGNLYVTSTEGVQVFDKDGNRTRVISVPEKTTNCTFGGVDKKTLFITAEKNLYTIPLDVMGFQHPFDLPDFMVLSIDDIDGTHADTLFFPNPVINNTVIIKSTNFDFSNTTFMLYNLNGKKVSEPDFYDGNNSQILKFDDALSRGVYILKMEGNHPSITKKIVLE